MGRPDDAPSEAPTAGEAPPPYEQMNNNSYEGAAPSYDGDSKARSVSSVGVKFPPTLNAYWQWKFTKTFYLGENKEEQRFAARMHTGFTKNRELELYDGLDDKGPLLATANHASMWNTRTTLLTIPAREGVGHDTESQRVELRTYYRGVHLFFTMIANVGPGKETRREEFEWRSSHGSEVKEVDGYKWGWKLVRILSEPVSGGGSRDTRAPGSTSDGHEVIAAWAFNNSMSMTKWFKFRLMGSALDGTLGDRGATLALISALRIFVMEYSRTTGAGTSVVST
ncbi:hypothetical protein F4861DRAFT_220879 [Xylaria intraflava]|nr:hypothetical protein F4861DRAFT_220879 [Xylaria intraflava]